MYMIVSILATSRSYLKQWPNLYLVVLCFFIICISSLYMKLKHQVLVQWPIVDALPSLVLNANRIHDWTVDISNKYGGTIVVRGPVFARLNILHTCDPRNMEYILKTHIENFPKGSSFQEAFDILGDGIINADSHSWYTQRTMARMSFTSKKVRSIIANMSQTVVQDAFLPLLEVVAKQSSVVDLQDVFLRYTFDTSFSILFGRNPGYLSIDFPPNKFAKAMDDSLDACFYRHMVPSVYWKICRVLMIGNERKMNRARKIIEYYLKEFIDAKKKDTVKGAETRDLLQVYMSLIEGEKYNIFFKNSDKFLRDTFLTYLFAGRDTTAAALTWFFWLLSKNPSVEAKILAELKLLYLKNNKNSKANRSWVFSGDDITEMVYLHAAMCESLRLYPSVPLVRRGALKDDVLPDGTVVKPGMMIILSNYAMGRMKWVWGKDCLEFKPERWIDETGKLNHETMSKLTAFNIGQRNCIGKDMAIVLMKTTASNMLFNFHVEVLEGQNILPRQSIALQMRNRLMVRIKKRTSIV